MPRTREQGQVVVKSILPNELEWKAFSALPPTVHLAVQIVEPSQPGRCVTRVTVASGVKLMAHRHPEDRIYTGMSGVFHIGFGDRFDGDRVKAYPPGRVIVLPGSMLHFHWARSSEYVTRERPSVR
jgi:uncharacterized RmlC-like cupin family protein